MCTGMPGCTGTHSKQFSLYRDLAWPWSTLLVHRRASFWPVFVAGTTLGDVPLLRVNIAGASLGRKSLNDGSTSLVCRLEPMPWRVGVSSFKACAHPINVMDRLQHDALHCRYAPQSPTWLRYSSPVSILIRPLRLAALPPELVSGR